MKVPPIDLARQYEILKDEIDLAVQGVLASGRYALGEEVERLEKELAHFVGADHAVACASGSDALLLSLMALKVREGDEVVTTPFTFFATASAIARLGARPVFADIEDETFNIDPERLDSAITDRTRAIIPVHLYGQCAQMTAINEIAGRRGIAVVEDACQALGAVHNGRMAGALGTLGTFSFYPTKNLSAAGDAGMITTNDGALASDLRRLRVHGSAGGYQHDEMGINSRMDAVQAAILRVKLPHLSEWTKRRQEIARLYSDALADLPVTRPRNIPGNIHVYHQYVIRAQGRDALARKLADDGIAAAIYYPLPLHLQRCFGYLGYRRGDFPRAERSAQEVLALPIFPEMTDEETRAVIRAVGRNLDASS